MVDEVSVVSYNSIMVETVLLALQVIVSILLVVCVLLQAPEGGLSPVFGGGGEMYRSKQTVEKFLITATIILAILLVILSVILLFHR
jgi:protein translocase SecG subunit